MMMMSITAKMMTMIIMMMMIKVGPGDDYVLTIEGFNDSIFGFHFRLKDSMITSVSGTNLNGMKFSTK